MNLQLNPNPKSKVRRSVPIQNRLVQLVTWFMLLTIIAMPVKAAPPMAGVESGSSAPLLQGSECAVPTFVDGLSKNVFTSISSEWIRQEAWVEAPFDSDFDGKLDRIHIDITRPPETADPNCNLKVPVIFEDSPYYANLGPSRNWNVDHELGFPPASRAEEPYFAAKNTSPIISTIYESTWLPRGYAVVHAESPGTGLSDGCPTSGGPNETLAGKAVIDWLNGRARAFTDRISDTQIYADWTTGKVAMMGTSYNGTLPVAVATTGVQGLEAIVPISAISNWYDYYRANGMVRAPFTYQGEDLDVLADAVYSRADESNPRTICKPVIADITANIDRATGDYSPFWNERNYMNDVTNVHAAVLQAHGNNDFNVMTKNMAQFYEAITALGVPHQLYFHRGGHGGSPPDVMINRWFTRYLYGYQNGVENLPKAWIVRETNACPARSTTATGDQSNVTTLAVADSGPLPLGFTATIPVTYADGSVRTTTRVITAIPDSTHITLASAVATSTGQFIADGALINIACSSANPTPYDEWPDPAAESVNINFTAGAPAVGALTFRPGSTTTETLIDDASVKVATSLSAPSSSIRLLYKSPVLAQDVRISGTPRVSLWMSFSKPKANLTAVLIDYPPTGAVTILTRGWMDPENRNSISVSDPITPGEFYRMDFDMQPKDAVVVAGHQIGVMIISSDNEATIRPAPGTELTMDLSQSSAILPIVGGPQALASAFGVTAPSIAYTLDPSNPTGQDGWYTGDVSLTWQIDDGGAALTVNGCGDETFTVDGQYQRSCTVSNLLGTAGPVTVNIKRDATPPALDPAVSPNPVLLNGLAVASPNASDDTSGVATESCAEVDASSVGDKTVACTATDVAGNQASALAAYNVIYAFSGFADPLVNPPDLNTANSGQVLPFIWRITDAGGNPVTDLQNVQLTVTTLPCSLGETDNLPQESPAGASGLQGLGDGYYQFNWKVPKSYTGSCKTSMLDLGEGTGMQRTALFQIVK
jgi:predicted acyl esterase